MTKRKAKPSPKASPKGKGRQGRTPARTVEQRIDRIAYLMIKGLWAKSRIPALASTWGVSRSAVCKLADRASVRVELAAGKLGELVVTAHLDLDAIQREARAAGQFTAAVRAVEMRLKLAGAFTPFRPGRGEPEGPRGLPPELAALNPPPSHEEVSHFAAVERVEDCTVEGCRVHGRAAPSPGAVH